jgi:hypothetical protein
MKLLYLTSLSLGGGWLSGYEPEDEVSADFLSEMRMGMPLLGDHHHSEHLFINSILQSLDR